MRYRRKWFVSYTTGLIYGNIIVDIDSHEKLTEEEIGIIKNKICKASKNITADSLVILYFTQIFHEI